MNNSNKSNSHSRFNHHHPCPLPIPPRIKSSPSNSINGSSSSSPATDLRFMEYREPSPHIEDPDDDMNEVTVSSFIPIPKDQLQHRKIITPRIRPSPIRVGKNPHGSDFQHSSHPSHSHQHHHHPYGAAQTHGVLNSTLNSSTRNPTSSTPSSSSSSSTAITSTTPGIMNVNTTNNNGNGNNNTGGNNSSNNKSSNSNQMVMSAGGSGISKAMDEMIFSPTGPKILKTSKVKS